MNAKSDTNVDNDVYKRRKKTNSNAIQRHKKTNIGLNVSYKDKQ